MELAGCYIIVTDVAKEKLSIQAVHDRYMALQKVERDFRTMKTGLLESRPLYVRKRATLADMFFAAHSLSKCNASWNVDWPLCSEPRPKIRRQ